MTRKELEKDMADINKMVKEGASIETIQYAYIDLIDYLWCQRTYTITQDQLNKLEYENKGNDNPGNGVGVLKMVDEIRKGEK